MNANELIEKLQSLPEEDRNLQVCIYDSEYAVFDKIDELFIENVWVNNYSNNDKEIEEFSLYQGYNTNKVKIINLDTL